MFNFLTYFWLTIFSSMAKATPPGARLPSNSSFAVTHSFSPCQATNNQSAAPFHFDFCGHLATPPGSSRPITKALPPPLIISRSRYTLSNLMIPINNQGRGDVVNQTEKSWNFKTEMTQKNLLKAKPLNLS